MQKAYYFSAKRSLYPCACCYIIAPNFDTYSHNDQFLGIRYDSAKEENRRKRENREPKGFFL